MVTNRRSLVPLVLALVAGGLAVWVGRVILSDRYGRNAASGVWENLRPDPLEGRVTDAATGMGIPDAEVAIKARGWDALNPLEIWRSPTRVWTVRTDANGRFSTRYRQLSRTTLTVAKPEFPQGRASFSEPGKLEIRMTHVPAAEGRPRDRFFEIPIHPDSTRSVDGVVAAIGLETFEVTADSTQGDVTIELLAEPESCVVVVAREGGGVLYRPIEAPREWKVQGAECLAPEEGYSGRVVISARDELGICFIRWDGGRKFARLELRPRWMVSMLGVPQPAELNVRGWTNTSGGRNLCPSGPAWVIEF